MKAIQYDAKSPSGLRMRNYHPCPYISKDNHVLCKVHACGVNPVDAKYVIGDKLPETWMDFCARVMSRHTPGFDFSGVVVSVPRCNKTGFSVGDEVYGLAANPTAIGLEYMKGSFAEMVLAPTNQICLKPNTLDHAHAAALPLVGTTAVQAFEEHDLKAGDKVPSERAKRASCEVENEERSNE